MNGKKEQSDGNGTAKKPKETVRIDIAPPAEIDIAKDRLGAVLSERRRVLGLKLEDVAEDIKIRAEYLRCLEDEMLDDLPTPQYARLFLKSYAERLGIDPSEAYALLDLCDFPTGAPPKMEAPPPGFTVPIVALEKPAARLPLGWLIVAGALAAAVILWLVFRSDQKTPDESGSPAAASEEVRQSVTKTAPEQVEAAPSETPEPMHLQLAFDRDTWVVLAADDDTVVNRVLHAGDQAEATATNRFLLTLGHTDGVETTVNGRRLLPFRARASRLSGVTITADSVLTWLDTGDGDSDEGAAENTSSIDTLPPTP